MSLGKYVYYVLYKHVEGRKGFLANWAERSSKKRLYLDDRLSENTLLDSRSRAMEFVCAEIHLKGEEISASLGQCIGWSISWCVCRSVVKDREWRLENAKS